MYGGKLQQTHSSCIFLNILAGIPVCHQPFTGLVSYTGNYFYSFISLSHFLQYEDTK